MRSAGPHAAGFASFPGVAGLGLREKQVLRFAQDDKCFFLRGVQEGGAQTDAAPGAPPLRGEERSDEAACGMGGNLASAARYFCARF